MKTTPIQFSLLSGPLRLSFVKHRDRYAQRLEIKVANQSNEAENADKGGMFMPLWETMEAVTAANHSSTDWPASPPLQEVHFETRPDGRQIALAVGRAGSSHWSLSVEPFTAGCGFVMDVACRVREIPLWLGSSYRRVTGKDQLLESATYLSDDHRNLSERIQFAPSPEFEEQTRLEFYLEGWNICPADLHGPLPRTIRWQYHVIGQA